MVKLVIAEADTKVYENDFKRASFVFIVVGNRLFYFDTTIGKMWSVDWDVIKDGKDWLGDGHRKIVGEMFK